MNQIKALHAGSAGRRMCTIEDEEKDTRMKMNCQYVKKLNLAESASFFHGGVVKHNQDNTFRPLSVSSRREIPQYPVFEDQDDFNYLPEESVSSSATVEKPKPTRLVIKFEGKKLSSVGSRREIPQYPVFENEDDFKDLPEESVSSSATVENPKPTRLVIKFMGKRLSSVGTDSLDQFIQRSDNKYSKSKEERVVVLPNTTRVVFKFRGNTLFSTLMNEEELQRFTANKTIKKKAVPLSSAVASSTIEKRKRNIVRFKFTGNIEEKKSFWNKILDEEESRAKKRMRSSRLGHN